jgi:hypothetical protein
MMTAAIAVAGSGEDHVFHACAAEAFGGLFAKHPAYGVAEIGCAAAVEAQLGAVTEGREALDFDTFQFQQSRLPQFASGGL